MVVQSLGKNALLKLITYLLNIDKIYLYAKDLHEPKYQILTDKCEQIGQKYFKGPKPFIDDSRDMNGKIDKYEYLTGEEI